MEGSRGVGGAEGKVERKEEHLASFDLFNKVALFFPPPPNDEIRAIKTATLKVMAR